VLYVSGMRGSGLLNALDAATGTLLWSGGTGIDSSSPAVSDGLVFVGSGGDEGGLFAFDASGCGQATCSPVWTAAIGGVSSSPAVAYGAVYVGSTDHVYAFDAATGALKWALPTGSAGLASPAVANGVVYMTTSDDMVRAIDARSGEVLWSYTMGDISNDQPAVADGWLFVSSFDMNLYAFHLPG
jgi:outer membrane protein assembly factor BamB